MGGERFTTEATEVTENRPSVFISAVSGLSVRSVVNLIIAAWKEDGDW
jgi:hypothetical protein